MSAACDGAVPTGAALTEDEEVAVARRAARTVAGRWGNRDWRDYLSAAWWGVRRANRRGVPRRCLVTAGYRAIIDLMRSERPDPSVVRRNRRHHVPRHVSGTEWVVEVDEARGEVTLPLFSTLAAPEREAPARDRLAALWAETRDRRAGMPHRRRLWLYLWLVEGWSQREVAAAFGVVPSLIYREIQASVVGLVGPESARRLLGLVSRSRTGESMRSGVVSCP